MKPIGYNKDGFTNYKNEEIECRISANALTSFIYANKKFRGLDTPDIWDIQIARGIIQEQKKSIDFQFTHVLDRIDNMITKFEDAQKDREAEVEEKTQN